MAQSMKCLLYKQVNPCVAQVSNLRSWTDRSLGSLDRQPSQSDLI